jgi:hypothetical protein
MTRPVAARAGFFVLPIVQLNPLGSSLYAAIADVELPLEHFDFGRGITIQRTFAHIFSPYLAAFAPAPPGQPHPTPWKAIAGGLAFDVLAELHVPLESPATKWFDRINTVWWFVALLRLSASPLAIVPVIASHPFASMAALTREPTFWPFEMRNPDRMIIDDPTRAIPSAALEWIKENCQPGWELMRGNSDFNVAFQAFDESIKDRSYSVALATLWGALERLFSPSHEALTFHMTANIAAFLEPAGQERLKLYESVKKLYGAQFGAANGAGDNNRAAFIETYRLLRRVLIKMIEARHVPTRDELEVLMFV